MNDQSTVVSPAIPGVATAHACLATLTLSAVALTGDDPGTGVLALCLCQFGATMALACILVAFSRSRGALPPSYGLGALALLAACWEYGTWRGFPAIRVGVGTGAAAAVIALALAGAAVAQWRGKRAERTL